MLGVGVETVGTDAGQAATFDPPFPNHYLMHGSGNKGVCGLKGWVRSTTRNRPAFSSSSSLAKTLDIGVPHNLRSILRLPLDRASNGRSTIVSPS